MDSIARCALKCPPTVSSTLFNLAFNSLYIQLFQYPNCAGQFDNSYSPAYIGACHIGKLTVFVIDRVEAEHAESLSVLGFWLLLQVTFHFQVCDHLNLIRWEWLVRHERREPLLSTRTSEIPAIEFLTTGCPREVARTSFWSIRSMNGYLFSGVGGGGVYSVKLSRWQFWAI